MAVSLDEGRITFGDRRERGLYAKDPVCGHDVELARAAASADHEGRTYYFDSLQCKLDFEKQPDRYLAEGR